MVCNIVSSDTNKPFQVIACENVTVFVTFRIICIGMAGKVIPDNSVEDKNRIVFDAAIELEVSYRFDGGRVP